MAARMERGARGGGVMSGHSVATLEAARQRIEFVAGKLNPLSSWHGTLAAIVERGHVRGSLKNWVHEGMELDTLQVRVKLEGGEPVGLSDAWSPAARIVEDVTATFFTPGGSRRDFAGMVTYAATGDYWAGFDSWGSDVVLVVYRRLS
mgnify:FL=1